MANPISDFVSTAQQALAQVDDSARMLGGIYWQASRLCEFENGADGWKPKTVNGAFVMLVTDEQLAAWGFNFTAQELGAALFGVVEIMAAIPTPLADLIGKVRS